jgi:hypothetical protein
MSSASPTTPGLLFDPADAPRLLAHTRTARWAPLWAEMTGADRVADTRFLREELAFDNHCYHMLRARQILERASFIHALTRDEAQLALARLALAKIVAYPKWDYFLEDGREVIALQRASEAVIAVLCAIDWLGESLPAGERAAAEEAVLTKGAPACFRTLYGLRYPDRVKGWGLDPEDSYPYRFSCARWPLILNATNLKVIPMTALGFAAAWFKGRHPEAERWLDLTRQSLRSYATMIGTDGSFDEQVSYWGYTMLHLGLLHEVFSRRLGIDEKHVIDYPASVRWAATMLAPARGPAVVAQDPGSLSVPRINLDPADGMLNLGDANHGLEVSFCAWVGRTFDDPLARHLLATAGTAQLFHGLIWYEPEAATASPGPALHDRRYVNDNVVARTGWGPDDGVFSLRSGGPANHEHADRNSVIFKVHGERLIHDPYRAAYSPAHPRWALRLTAAHSAVLIDGQGHQYHRGEDGTNASWAWARVTAFRPGADWVAVTSDATEAYALEHEGLTRVERTVVYLKPDLLVIADRVAAKRPVTVETRYQVFNDDNLGQAEATAPHTFTITRPLAVLRAVSAASTSCQVRADQLDLPVEQGRFPYAAVTAAPAAHVTLVTACAATPVKAPASKLQVEADGADTWIITGTHRNRTINLTLRWSAETAAPEIVVGGENPDHPIGRKS